MASLRYDFRRDPILGPAYAYWRAKCGARAMPRRADIDPTEIPKLLPNIQLTELVDGGARIRYRLTGTAIVDAYGGEVAGKYFDEIYAGERLRYIEARYREVCENRCAVYVCNRYFSAMEVELICHRVVMPLSEDGATVNQCLTAMSFQFPGDAGQWVGQWAGTSGNFDFAKSYSELVR